MCGIVGFMNWSNVVSQTPKKWFTAALFVDTLRGSDGTGIAILPELPFAVNTPAKDIGVYKKALAAPDFLQLNRVDSLMSDVARARFALGHNRAATQGDKTKDDNAHPFQIGDITMVHNGTLVTRNGLSTYDQVDSKSIAIQLSNTPPEKYGELCAKLDGAFTLIWHNASTNKVYFARNKERPLIMGSGNDGETLFFASEQWMVTQLLSRYSSDTLDIDEKNYYKTWAMPTNNVFEYDCDVAPTDIKEADAKTPFDDYEAPKHYTPPTRQLPATTGGKGSNSGVNYSGTVVNITANSNAPVKVGDYFYADKWNWLAQSQGAKRGTLSGVASDFPNIGFSVGNIMEKKYLKLLKEFEEYSDWISNGDKDLDDDYLREVLLEGVVTQVTELRNGKDFIVQLKPSSLRVDCLETPIADVIEGGDPEKKPDATWVNQVTTGAYKLPTGGFGSYKEWCNFVKDGCIYCKSAFIAHEHKEIMWFVSRGEYEPVCKSCQSTPHTLN